MTGERGNETCQHDERYQERKHAGTHAQRNARFLLQTISGNDRVGYQGIGSHDAAQQKRCPGGIVQQPDAHAEGEEEGNEAGEQTIDDEPRFVFLHTLHVHLQGGEEHNVVESHLAEQLERCISFQDVQSVFTHEDTRQHHSDDMRNSEFTHDDRGKEDDEEHYEEDQRRVGNWKIFCNIQHRHSTYC